MYELALVCLRTTTHFCHLIGSLPQHQSFANPTKIDTGREGFLKDQADRTIRFSLVGLLTELDITIA